MKKTFLARLTQPNSTMYNSATKTRNYPKYPTETIDMQPASPHNVNIPQTANLPQHKYTQMRKCTMLSGRLRRHSSNTEQ